MFLSIIIGMGIGAELGTTIGIALEALAGAALAKGTITAAGTLTGAVVGGTAAAIDETT